MTLMTWDGISKGLPAEKTVKRTILLLLSSFYTLQIHPPVRMDPVTADAIAHYLWNVVQSCPRVLMSDQRHEMMSLYRRTLSLPHIKHTTLLASRNVVLKLMQVGNNINISFNNSASFRGSITVKPQ